MGGLGVSTYLSLIGRRRGGRLFEAGRLLTFSAFRMGAYSRWALIRGWALIRINTVSMLLDSRTNHSSTLLQGVMHTLEWHSEQSELILSWSTQLLLKEPVSSRQTI